MLGERRADQAERCRQPVDDCGDAAARPGGRPVLLQIVDELGPESFPERGGKEPYEGDQPPAHERAVPRRFSASAAAPLSRPASAARERRPAAVSA